MEHLENKKKIEKELKQKQLEGNYCNIGQALKQKDAEFFDNDKNKDKRLELHPEGYWEKRFDFSLLKSVKSNPKWKLYFDFNKIDILNFQQFSLQTSRAQILGSFYENSKKY